MTKIIVDCDPGHDDAMTLLYAAKMLDLVGVTTVFGNTTVEKTTFNALSICRLAKIDVPVAKGMDRPIIASCRPIAMIDMHGASGIDGAELPEPDREPVNIHAVEFIIEQARLHKGQMTIVAIGPLTNIAMALKYEPRLADWISAISIMGGSTTTGNVTALAEYNIYCDPEAAAVVFQSGARILMAGLNVTRQAVIAKPHIERLNASNGPVGRAFAGLLDFYRMRAIEVFNLPGASMHDPCAVIPFVEPGLINHQLSHVHVECLSPQLRGMTACDLRTVNPQVTEIVAANSTANAEVAVEIDGRTAVNHVIDVLASYD